MKILYITPGCFDKGGISRYNRYQIQVLRETYGNENIRVLSLLGPDAHSFEGDYAVYWHGNGVSAKDKIGLISKVTGISLSWKPDCIWVAHVNLSGLAVMASKLCGAKTVLNVYGLEVWSRMRRDAAWGLRKAGSIVADCHNTAAYLVKNNIRNQKDITVVWDCIDTTRFKPTDSVNEVVLKKYRIPDPRKHFVVLSLGRLAKPDAFYKGYDRLLKAVALLKPSYPGIRLVFAGRGNYREDLERMAGEMNMNAHVSFTGSVDEEDLVAVYQSCQLFSLVTEAGEGKGEGIPLTPLEAMACGKPILVGNQDGSREAVIDGKNGCVLDPADVIAQQQTIEKYMKDPVYLQTQSGQAAVIGREIFSYSRFKAETLGFIEEKL